MVKKGYTETIVPSLYEDQEDGINVAGVIVDSDTYDGGTFLDRDYDVRGLGAFAILIENIHGSNGLTYSIQEATKNYSDLDVDLADADFVNVSSHTDVNVASGTKSAVYTLNPADSTITAVRLRAKRTVASNDSLLRADIRAKK